MRGKEGGPYCETEINNMIGTAIWWIWDWDWKVWDWNLVDLGLGLESLLTWVVRDELDNWRSLLGVGEAWGGV